MGGAAGAGGSAGAAASAGTGGAAGAAGTGATGACSGAVGGAAGMVDAGNSGCPPLMGDCDGDPSNGCETDFGTDVDHCGGCGRACGGPNTVSSSCIFGQCTLGCEAFFGDCNCDPFDGCETSIVTATDCGGCGKRCGNQNTISSSCEQGPPISCTVVCAPNFANCDNDLSNGCEADLMNDVPHCGGCDACDRDNATASCSAGSCSFTCHSGFADCNGSDNDGCEVDTSIDPRHCNGCNNDCMGGVCENGMCSTAPQVLYPSHQVAAFTFDATHLYWLEAVQNNNPGRLFKAPKGGGVVVELLGGITHPRAIDVDATDVFFISLGGLLQKIPKNGGAVTDLSSQCYLAHIGLSATDVYCGDINAIYTVPKAGGPATEVWGHNPVDIVVQGGDLFHTDDGLSFERGVYRNSTRLVDDLDAGPIGVDATRVYWAGDGRMLKSIPIGGGTESNLVSIFNVIDLAVGSSHVYFFDSDFLIHQVWGRALYRVPVGGGSLGAVAAVQGQGGRQLKTDATHVYWATPLTRLAQ